jgi:hypothetical protein
MRPTMNYKGSITCGSLVIIMYYLGILPRKYSLYLGILAILIGICVYFYQDYKKKSRH